MSLTYVGDRGTASFTSTSSQNTAAPIGTLAGDLLVLALAGVRMGQVTASPGYTPLQGARGHGIATPDDQGPLSVFVRRADASDEVPTISTFVFSGSHNVTYSVTAWRDAPGYTEANDESDDAATTSHDVPDVIVPTADTEIIVCATIDNFLGQNAANEAGTIPGFTLRSFHTGIDFFDAFDPSNPTIVQLSKHAGSVGLQGPWTMTTAATKYMDFVVLGIVPVELGRGCVTLPYFIPLGNQPAA